MPNALLLNATTLKDRVIKVETKRTNIPFINQRRGRGRNGGRGFCGRDGYRRGFRARGRDYTPY